MKLDTLERKPEDAADDSLNPANRHGTTDMSEFENEFAPKVDTEPGSTDMSEYEKQFGGGGQGTGASSGSTKSATELKDAESKTADDTVGKGFNSSSKHGDDTKGGKNVKGDQKFWTNKKKAGVGVGALMGGGVAILGLGTLTTGTTAAMMAASALHLPSEHGEQQSSDRISKAMAFYRFAQSGDVGHTRLGIIGGKVFEKSMTQLKEAGVEFKRDPITGKVQATQIDQEKLAKKLPALEGVQIGSDTARQIVAEELKVNIDRVTVNGGQMTVDMQGANQKSLRLLTENSARIVSDSRAVGTAKSMFMKKAFNNFRLLHPFKKLTAAAEQKLIDAYRARQEKKGKSAAEAEKEAKAGVAIEGEKANFTDTMKPFEAKATSSAEAIKSSQSGFTSTVVKGLTITGTLCIVRGVAVEIATANRAIVAEPAAAQATRIKAAGGQAGVGADMTIDQVNAMVQSWNAADGSSIFDGKAMQVLLEPNKQPKGPDLDPEYKQAFSGDSTAAKFKEGAETGLGGESIASVACSPGGLITQAALGVAVTIGGEVFSGGTATPVIAALWAAKFAGSTIVSMVAVSAVIDIIKSFAINNQLPQKAFAGAMGGNLVAYGAREASNIVGIASGGVSLGNNTTTRLATDDDELEAPRNLATRLFDLHDDHSLMTQAATTYYTSGFANEGVMTGLSNVASSLTNIGSMVGNIFGSLTPRASAAANYDWGFPQYAIPDSVMNNPEFDNPWTSGDKAATDTLDGPNSKDYIEKASSCFGWAINKDSDGKWDVTRDHMVDITSEDYTDADCNEKSTVDGEPALNWQRIMMFGFDTVNMKDAACASGADETVCADKGGSSAPATTTPPSTTPTDQNGQGVQLDGVDGLIVSNQFTDDTTIIPKVTNIVIHWIDSNPESPEEVHSALASSNTSVQFYVSQSGKMMQLTPYANSKAHHAKNANEFAVGIEIGSPNAESIGDTAPYPQLENALINNATQKAQVIKLATALAKKFGITNITVGNQTLYTPGDTCAALGLSFPGTCATQAEAAQFGIVGHYQLQDTKADPGRTYVTQIQQGVKSGLGL